MTMHFRHAKQNIPIELLRSLVAIADLKSFTRVAETLSLTQPAVSAQIKRLQILLGGDLFDKQGTGVSLSEQGALIVRYARRLLAINDQILSLTRPSAGADGRVVRLGVSSTYINVLLEGIESLNIAMTSGVRVQISHDIATCLFRDLRQGYLDVVIAVDEISERAHTYWDEEIVWARSASQPIIADTIPIVALPESRAHRLAIEALDRAKIPYETVFVTTSIPILIDAVAAGVGVAALTRRSVPGRLGIAEDTRLPKLPRMTGGIYLRDGFDADLFDPLLEQMAHVVQPCAEMRMSTRPLMLRQAG